MEIKGSEDELRCSIFSGGSLETPMGFFLSKPGEVRCVTTLPTGGLAFGSMETWIFWSQKTLVFTSGGAEFCRLSDFGSS